MRLTHAPQVALWIIFAVLCTSCATYRASFLDTDGTFYEVRAMSAPFALSTDSTRWKYAWDSDGGSITVGADRATDAVEQATLAAEITRALIAAGLVR